MDGIGRTWFSLRRRAEALIKERDYDLTFPQIMILMLLNQHGGVSLSELSEHADREKTTMTRMVDGLESRNMVIRVPDRQDRRQKLIYLTNSGREKVAEIQKLKPSMLDIATAGINKKEMDQCIAILQKVVDNLESE